MNRRVRVLIPILLSACGFSMLSGCFFIPTFDKVVEGENVARQVGGRESDRAVRVGHTSRDEVVRRLGQPDFASPDGTQAVYRWQVRNGVYVWPLCFHAYGRFGGRALALRFDRAGVLEGFEILKQNGNWYVNTAYGPDMPAGVEPIEHLPGWPATHPATRPTTAPATGPAAPSPPPATAR